MVDFSCLIPEQQCNATNKLIFHAGTFTAVSVVTTTMCMFCPTCVFLINKHESYRIRMKQLCLHPVRSNTCMLAVSVCVACSCAGQMFWYMFEFRRTFVTAKHDFSNAFLQKLLSVFACASFDRQWKLSFSCWPCSSVQWVGRFLKHNCNKHTWKGSMRPALLLQKFRFYNNMCSTIPW